MTDHNAIQPHNLMQTISDQINLAWDVTEALPETQRNAIQAALSAVWEQNTALFELVQIDEALLAESQAMIAGLQAMATKLAEQRDAIAAELDSLTESIEGDHWDDDRLKDFVKGVQDWAAEMFQDEGEESAWNTIYDEIDENFEAYGFTGPQASQALNLLRGNTTLNQEQAEVLNMLLDSIVPDEDMS